MTAPQDDLLARLTDDDPDRAAEAARALGAVRLLDVLTTTEDPAVRVAAALALSDMRVPEARDVIAGLLTQERTRGRRGTLVYALEPYDCGPLLPLLVDLIVEDNYEVAREAARLIDHTDADLDRQTWDRLVARLEAALEATDPPYAIKDPERREQVIRPVLQIFYDGEDID
ncbi:HEAT repeat protein [Actinoplanes octamycinicus]|uniref:HEAT repeat protein n=1 Tax=Actinoplanes octamycinicus TaxID=135948 RepID=A0A7W7H0J6_9ACTN|nr:HEAT repeat domain-containing protein [Actinoplanes octamycinicus]MBB4741672.1 HEAT repeat protein [Actinoplanes octamycinicus]GIE57225.1 hypothetical protein Aoc01nite_26270 [Actinoplanes octamycinicus]